MADENILDNIVRVGIVSAVDPAGKKARVIFRDKGLPSGWLSVLQHGAAGVYVKETVSGDHPSHSHAATVTVWMPAINDTVVVLYLPVFNGDGFILGAI